MSFKSLSLKDKILVIIIGTLSIWIAIKLMPKINEIIANQIPNKFFVEVILMFVIYLLAVWIFPFFIIKTINLILKR